MLLRTIFCIFRVDTINHLLVLSCFIEERIRTTLIRPIRGADVGMQLRRIESQRFIWRKTLLDSWVGLEEANFYPDAHFSDLL
ncbi:MAG: hypothetical protein EXR17_06620 [Flavobacteriaceae bacterium]|nr:hypothetical protein [Flavobacteriaceae bacterium]